MKKSCKEVGQRIKCRRNSKRWREGWVRRGKKNDGGGSSNSSRLVIAVIAVVCVCVCVRVEEAHYTHKSRHLCMCLRVRMLVHLCIKIAFITCNTHTHTQIHTYRGAMGYQSLVVSQLFRCLACKPFKPGLQHWLRLEHPAREGTM